MLTRQLDVRQRLLSALPDVGNREKEHQTLSYIFGLLETQDAHNTVNQLVRDLLAGLDHCGKTAARARLLAATHAIKAHGTEVAAPQVLALLVAYISSQAAVVNSQELCELGEQVMQAFLVKLVQELMLCLTSPGSASDLALQASEQVLTEQLLLPVLKIACRGPQKSSMSLASCLAERMLLCCQGFVHVKQVIAAAGACLENLLSLIGPGNLESSVPQVLLPIQRCIALLSIGQDAACVRRVIALCSSGAAMQAWQFRQNAVDTLGILVDSVQMADPLFPGERRLVLTPAFKAVQKLQSTITQVAQVRRAAHSAAEALSGLPPASPRQSEPAGASTGASHSTAGLKTQISKLAPAAQKLRQAAEELPIPQRHASPLAANMQAAAAAAAKALAHPASARAPGPNSSQPRSREALAGAVPTKQTSPPRPASVKVRLPAPAAPWPLQQPLDDDAGFERQRRPRVTSGSSAAQQQRSTGLQRKPTVDQTDQAPAQAAGQPYGRARVVASQSTTRGEGAKAGYTGAEPTKRYVSGGRSASQPDGPRPKLIRAIDETPSFHGLADASADGRAAKASWEGGVGSGPRRSCVSPAARAGSQRNHPQAQQPGQPRQEPSTRSAVAAAGPQRKRWSVPGRAPDSFSHELDAARSVSRAKTPRSRRATSDVSSSSPQPLLTMNSEAASGIDAEADRPTSTGQEAAQLDQDAGALPRPSLTQSRARSATRASRGVATTRDWQSGHRLQGPRAAVYASEDRGTQPSREFLRADRRRVMLAIPPRPQLELVEPRIRRPGPLPDDCRDFGVLMYCKPPPELQARPQQKPLLSCHPVINSPPEVLASAGANRPATGPTAESESLTAVTPGSGGDQGVMSLTGSTAAYVPDHKELPKEQATYSEAGAQSFAAFVHVQDPALMPDIHIHIPSPVTTSSPHLSVDPAPNGSPHPHQASHPSGRHPLDRGPSASQGSGVVPVPRQGTAPAQGSAAKVPQPSAGDNAHQPSTQAQATARTSPSPSKSHPEQSGAAALITALIPALVPCGSPAYGLTHPTESQERGSPMSLSASPAQWAVSPAEVQGSVRSPEGQSGATLERSSQGDAAAWVQPTQETGSGMLTAGGSGSVTHTAARVAALSLHVQEGSASSHRPRPQAHAVQSAQQPGSGQAAVGQQTTPAQHKQMQQQLAQSEPWHVHLYTPMLMPVPAPSPQLDQSPPSLVKFASVFASPSPSPEQQNVAWGAADVSPAIFHSIPGANVAGRSSFLSDRPIVSPHASPQRVQDLAPVSLSPSRSPGRVARAQPRAPVRELPSERKAAKRPVSGAALTATTSHSEHKAPGGRPEQAKSSAAEPGGPYLRQGQRLLHQAEADGQPGPIAVRRAERAGTSPSGRHLSPQRPSAGPARSRTAPEGMARGTPPASPQQAAKPGASSAPLQQAQSSAPVSAAPDAPAGQHPAASRVLDFRPLVPEATRRPQVQDLHLAGSTASSPGGAAFQPGTHRSDSRQDSSQTRHTTADRGPHLEAHSADQSSHSPQESSQKASSRPWERYSQAWNVSVSKPPVGTPEIVTVAQKDDAVVYGELGRTPQPSPQMFAPIPVPPLPPGLSPLMPAQEQLQPPAPGARPTAVEPGLPATAGDMGRASLSTGFRSGAAVSGLTDAAGIHTGNLASIRASLPSYYAKQRRYAQSPERTNDRGRGDGSAQWTPWAQDKAHGRPLEGMVPAQAADMGLRQSSFTPPTKSASIPRSLPGNPQDAFGEIQMVIGRLQALQGSLMEVESTGIGSSSPLSRLQAGASERGGAGFSASASASPRSTPASSRRSASPGGSPWYPLPLVGLDLASSPVSETGQQLPQSGRTLRRSDFGSRPSGMDWQPGHVQGPGAGGSLTSWADEGGQSGGISKGFAASRRQALSEAAQAGRGAPIGGAYPGGLTAASAGPRGYGIVVQAHVRQSSTAGERRPVSPLASGGRGHRYNSPPAESSRGARTSLQGPGEHSAGSRHSNSHSRNPSPDVLALIQRMQSPRASSPQAWVTPSTEAQSGSQHRRSASAWGFQPTPAIDSRTGPSGGDAAHQVPQYGASAGDLRGGAGLQKLAPPQPFLQAGHTTYTVTTPGSGPRAATPREPLQALRSPRKLGSSVDVLPSPQLQDNEYIVTTLTEARTSRSVNVTATRTRGSQDLNSAARIGHTSRVTMVGGQAGQDSTMATLMASHLLNRAFNFADSVRLTDPPGLRSRMLPH